MSRGLVLTQWRCLASLAAGGPKEPDVTLGECLEWWDEGDGLIKFKVKIILFSEVHPPEYCERHLLIAAHYLDLQDIGSMHSELVGLDEGGSLRQWKWTSSKPTQHPKTQSLGLDKEKVGGVVVFVFSIWKMFS